MSNDDPFLNSENRKILATLSENENGKAIADNLLKKFSVLSNKYRQLDSIERSRVNNDLNEKIKDALGELEKTLSTNEFSEDASSLMHFWCLICVLIIFG